MIHGFVELLDTIMIKSDALLLHARTQVEGLVDY